MIPKLSFKLSFLKKKLRYRRQRMMRNNILPTPETSLSSTCRQQNILPRTDPIQTSVDLTLVSQSEVNQSDKR